MATNAYIGVNNVAKKMAKAYIGVDGVAKPVKKMYVGVDGVAKLCYQSTSWKQTSTKQYSDTISFSATSTSTYVEMQAKNSQFGITAATPFENAYVRLYGTFKVGTTSIVLKATALHTVGYTTIAPAITYSNKTYTLSAKIASNSIITFRVTRNKTTPKASATCNISITKVEQYY